MTTQASPQAATSGMVDVIAEMPVELVSAEVWQMGSIWVSAEELLQRQREAAAMH